MFWFGAAVSLCYLPGLTGAYIATQWPFLSLVLPVMLLFRSAPITYPHVFGALFVIYAATRFYFPVPTYDGVFGLWLVVIMSLCMWFGSTLTTVRSLYAGLAVGGAVSSAVAVLQYFGVHLVGVADFNGKPPGIYVNSVQQGTVLALIAVALVTERMWFWVVPLVPGLLFANSRGAWLALAVGVIGTRVRSIWLFCISAPAVMCYVVFMSERDHERFLTWSAAWANLAWFGWGPGSFFTLILTDINRSWLPEHAHNDALQLVFEYGVGAALLLPVFAFALSRTGVKEWPVILAFAVAGCYSMPLFMPLASFVALVAVGRVLRGAGVVLGNSDHRGRYFLPWRRGSKEARSGAVSVAPGHSAAR